MKRVVKLICIPITAVVVVLLFFFYEYEQNITEPVDTVFTVSPFQDIPEGLELVTINGKLRPYVTPDGSPLPSELEPGFELVTDRDYPEINGHIVIALYNVPYYPANPEYVQITGYFDPDIPDWYYPEQGRTKQVIFVEDITELESVDLRNKYTTQQLRDRYDQIHKEFEVLKDDFISEKISHEVYLSALESLAEHEMELFQDVKEHTFERNEMTEYNFWHRGVMKFPTTLEQEVAKLGD
ncbi:hypothetical protein [Nitrosopumilus sp.]|uniref:hypothetical protein n=1 Tax=Nitrosopumilus sp. TaxID=2024843 RepID=UPI003B59062B